MTSVLITGSGSYVGTSIMNHLGSRPQEWRVQELDVRNGIDEAAFQGQDVVIHVAGIAHQRETAENAPLYHQVNCELAVETARIARKNGVKQFIFFSSMSVYGMLTGRITAQTPLAPNTFYGRSKLAAEKALEALDGDDFRIAVLRPPMIYGRGCKGNYPRLAALAGKLPVFPSMKNQRSMLYIGTLCAFVEALIRSGKGGLFFPQNREYVSTGELVRCIARCRGRSMLMLPGFGWLISMAMHFVPAAAKVFGSLTYDMAMSADFAGEGQLDFAETIRRTEDVR